MFQIFLKANNSEKISRGHKNDGPQVIYGRSKKYVCPRRVKHALKECLSDVEAWSLNSVSSIVFFLSRIKLFVSESVKSLVDSFIGTWPNYRFPNVEFTKCLFSVFILAIPVDWISTKYKSRVHKGTSTYFTVMERDSRKTRRIRARRGGNTVKRVICSREKQCYYFIITKITYRIIQGMNLLFPW